MYRLLQLIPAMRVSQLLAATLVLLSGTELGAYETWGERLGYPAEKRVLILNARHAGMAYESSQSVKELLTDELIQTASAMPPCPWFGEFANWSNNNGQKNVGLSLTITSESPNYRWRPISPRTEVPSLVDLEGFLRGSALELHHNADPEDVEREIVGQILAARRAGVQPAFLDAHNAALFVNIEFTRVYLSIARRYWIPAVMLELTPDHVERFRSEGLPIEEEMIALIADYPLPKLDDLQFMPAGDSYEIKRDKFYKLVRELPPGLIQIAAYPAVESEGLKKISPLWQQQVWDARLLSDPDVRKFLKEEEVEFTNWTEMMQRFEN